MGLGFLGIIVPLLPDLILIFVAVLIYGAFTSFEVVTVTLILIYAGLALVALLFDYLATVYGAKKHQASSWGQLGAIVGVVVGLLTPGFLFIIIGPIIGVIIFEMIFAQRNFKEALEAGKGAFWGFILGSLIKIILAVIMIGWFIKLII
jgi:uncharacterized protein